MLMRVGEIILQSSKDFMHAKVRVINEEGEGIPNTRITGFWLKPQSRKKKSNKHTNITDQHGWATFQTCAMHIGCYTFKIRRVNEKQIDDLLSSFTSAMIMYKPIQQLQCRRIIVLQDEPTALFAIEVVDEDCNSVDHANILSRWQYQDEQFESYLSPSGIKGIAIVEFPKSIKISDHEDSARLISLNTNTLYVKEARFVLSGYHSTMVEALIKIVDSNLTPVNRALLTYEYYYPSGRIKQRTISTNSSGQAYLYGLHEEGIHSLKIINLEKTGYKCNPDVQSFESSFVVTSRQQSTLTVAPTQIVITGNAVSPVLEAPILVLDELSADFLDEKERAVADAQVKAIWHGPLGEKRHQRRHTDSEGMSQFTIEASSSGVWTLQITAIHHDDYPSCHLKHEIKCPVKHEGKIPVQGEVQRPTQNDQALEIETPPGITIRDKLVQSNTMAELIGEFYVKVKSELRQRISDAQVIGFWIDPKGIRKNISGKTNTKGKFASSILTSGAGKYKLVINSIEKNGYIFPFTPSEKSWNGVPCDSDTDSNEGLPKTISVLRRRYNYSVSASVSVHERHHALNRAVKDENGLGLAYVVRFLTQLNRYHKNNPRHTDAIERRRDDIR